MRQGWGEFARNRAAVATLDFAILVVPMLVLIFGTIEFGRLFWAREALETAAIEGARCMAVPEASCASGGAYSSSNTTSFIKNLASAWGITLTDADIQLTQSATTGGCAGLAASVSEVTLSYTFETVVPGLLTMLSGGTSLTGTACFPQQT